MNLAGKTAVITGGASGIGRAVAAAMGRAGVHGLALVDMSEAAEDVAAKLNAEAGRVFAIPFQGDTINDRAIRNYVGGSIYITQPIPGFDRFPGWPERSRNPWRDRGSSYGPRFRQGPRPNIVER